LAEKSAQQEAELVELRRTLRKQQHNSATLFEIISQIGARSLDVAAMQTYLLRTIAGQFTTPKLLILRRPPAAGTELAVVASQGVRESGLRVAANSPLYSEAIKRRFCFYLRELPASAAARPEVATLLKRELELAVPLIQEIESPTVALEGLLLLGPRLGGRPYQEEDVEFLHILGKTLAICYRNEALYRHSIVDDLTGVYSRGYFDARLTQEINRVRIYGHPSLGLLMLDLDQFKQVNDRYGHQSGDRVLQEVARVLLRQVRSMDLVARYGGEEFAIILLEIDHHRAGDIAERLRCAVEALETPSLEGYPLKITASFGAACFPNNAVSKVELIQQADQALYEAKDRGRNCVVVAPASAAAAPAAPPDSGGPAPTSRPPPTGEDRRRRPRE
jgi:diguanylate cyclase (GGDEF)-like protein